jgi:uroporphyrinogen decarboxylase
MTPRERAIRSLEFDSPDRAPRHLWTLPGVQSQRADELRAMTEMFPEDFASPPFAYGKAERAQGEPYRRGSYTDEWGCTFEVLEDGVVGEVKTPLLQDWDDLHRVRPPFEILEADWNSVSQVRDPADRFILASTTVRPFERMQFLRGTENLMVDIALRPREFFELRDIIHEFFLAELEHWVKTGVDGISFMDDWGSQTSLLISPESWRVLYKPLYREYCDLIHSHGKYVFFHSDGNIEEIIPDLVEIGVDALNSQLFCMNLERIASRFKGQVTFWGEIDRQWLLPFGTPDEVREGVRRVRAVLDDGSGGVIAQCEWGLRDPFENIKAVFEAWLE